MGVKYLNFLLLSLAGLAFAEDGDFDLFDLSLDQLAQIRISSATLTERSLLEIPASITVFSGEQIRAMGIMTLEELANYVPGFQSQRSGIKAHVRPISARAYRKNDNANEILVLLNGARLNDGLGGGVFSMSNELPVSHAERVEFIRGPGSALYGGNAMTAVINIITRTEGNDISLGSGSEARESVQINYHQSDNSLHYEQYRDAGQRYHNLPDANNTRYENFRDPNERRHLFISRERDNYFVQLYAGRNEFNDFWTNELFTDYNQPTSLEALLLNGRIDLFAQGNFKSQLNLRYFRGKQDVYGQTYGSGSFSAISNPASDEPYLGRSWFGTEEIEISLVNWLPLGEDGHIVLGAQYYAPNMLGGDVVSNYNLEQLANNNFPVDYNPSGITTDLLTDQNRTVSALFGQYENHWGAWHLTTGARYEDYADIGSHLSPRASLVYRVNPQNSLKFLYGHAFRPPTTAETGFSNNSVLISNPDLKPEIIDTYEVNWVFQPATWWAQAGVYRSTVSDGIVLYTKPETGSTRYYRNNTQRLVMSGGEIEIIRPLWSNSELRIGGSQQFEMDEEYNNLSKNQLTANLNHQFKQWHFNLNYYYFGEIDYVTSDGLHHTAGAYGITGAKIRYALSANSNISLSGSNILNRQYTTPARTSAFAAGLPERDRQLTLNFEISNF